MKYFARFALIVLTLFTANLAYASGYNTDYDKTYDAEGIAKPWQMNFQEPASPVMEELVGLHNFVFVIVAVITIFVMALMVYVLLRFNSKANPVPNKNAHNTLIEVIWTVIPVLILIAIAIPSFRVHFDCVHTVGGCGTETPPENPDLTLKIIGYQWYWNYEYPEHGIQFDSNIKPDEELGPNEPRLLSVDNPVIVPVNANVRVLLTGGDVIHDWAVPAFGIKQDAVPGRLNETWFKATKEGTYYGQCSELCGRLHGFMPIKVEVLSQEKYDAWIADAKQRFAKDDFGSVTQAAAQ